MTWRVDSASLWDLWELYAEAARKDSWWFSGGQKEAVRPWRGKPIPIPQKSPPPEPPAPHLRPWNRSMLRQNPPPEEYFYVWRGSLPDSWVLELRGNGWHIDEDFLGPGCHHMMIIVRKTATEPQVDSRTATERFMGFAKEKRKA